jgi:hypothetical protein
MTAVIVRKGPDSDVYIYSSMSTEGFICQACKLHPQGLRYKNVHLRNHLQVQGHMEMHMAMGHMVPAGKLQEVKKAVTYQTMKAKFDPKEPVERKVWGARINYYGSMITK